MRPTFIETPIVFVAFLAVSVAAGSPAALAQTAEERAAEYRREAMEQALETKARYDHYGIRFATDEAVLSAESEALIDDIATALGDFPEWRLRIVGHTDATGDEVHNEHLSLERAKAVKAALTARGVDPLRTIAMGLGEERPVASNDTPEGRALNRRVELMRVSDSAEARNLLKAMSDHLAAQEVLAFDYDAMLEVVTTAGQKLGLANSGSVTLARPDRIRARRTGGFVDVELSFDGTRVTVLGKNANVFLAAEEPGTVDQLVDTLREDYGVPLPAADLLLSDPYAALMDHVFDVKDLGSGVIGGTECDWLAFRTDDVDWQIWIAQGAEPFPCRYVITTKQMEHAPQYSVTFANWRSGAGVETPDFAFENVTGASQVTREELAATLGGLPSHFSQEN